MPAAPTEHLHPRSAPNFDAIARVYRVIEYLSFGPLLERCRVRFLADCAHSRRALVLGDGDGRFTARLLAANPNIHVDAVDLSPAMLRLLQRRAVRVRGEARLQTLRADLRDFTPVGEYDLVVSHFSLDCFTERELDAMVACILPHLTPRATWLVSEFAIPRKGWRSAAARALIRALYFAFEKLTHLEIHSLPDYARVLTTHDFSLKRRIPSAGGLLVAETWQRAERPRLRDDLVSLGTTGDT